MVKGLIGAEKILQNEIAFIEMLDQRTWGLGTGVRPNVSGGEVYHR